MLDVGDCVFIESVMPIFWNAADKHRCRVLAVRAVKPSAHVRRTAKIANSLTS